MKTLSTTLKLLAIAGLMLAAISCKRDHEPAHNLALPKAENVKDLQARALKDITQTAHFKAEEGITFTSAKGAILRINANCLQDPSNHAVAGEVVLSFVEIYDRTNMVVTHKPTMGVDENGNKLPMITGGEFNIEVKKGDEILRSGCPFSLIVPTENTGGLDADMVLWKGVIDDNGDLAWNEVGANGRERLNIDEKGVSYNLLLGDFGWTNVDRFWSYEGPKTQIKVTVPQGYNNTNASVYLAYEDQPGLLAQLDTYNAAEGYFSEHYGFVPVGLNVHVIFTSESNGEVVYAIKPVTITNNAVTTVHTNELRIGNHETAKNAIRNIR